MGNPQWVDEIVFPQSKQEKWFWRKHVCRDLSSYRRLVHIVNKEGKEKKSNKEKLAFGQSGVIGKA